MTICFRPRILPLTVAVVFTLLASAAPAAAEPTKDECVDANTSAQNLRRAHKLRASRDQLLLCSSASCPSLVRDDCAQRMEELDRALPSVVFEARDAKGQDLSAVKVTMDGAALAERLDGTAFVVDPGEHTFSFAVAGESTVTRRLVLVEGEKSRRESIVFGVAKIEATLTVAAGAGDDITVDGSAAGTRRWSGPLPPGSHEVRVTHAGKKPYQRSVDLTPGGVRTLDVTLEEDRRGIPAWAWVAGGVVVAGGLALGGYFLFRPKEEPGARPIGGMDSVTLSFPGIR